MIDNLIDQLRRDEGEVLHAYTDQLGYLTIGVGHLIDRRKGGGISPEISARLLDHDICRTKDELFSKLPWITSLDPIRAAVLINMAFNMGVDGLLEFHNTLAMVKAGNYEAAANGMLNSLWARQVPDRAKRLADQMKTGEWR